MCRFEYRRSINACIHPSGMDFGHDMVNHSTIHKPVLLLPISLCWGHRNRRPTHHLSHRTSCCCVSAPLERFWTRTKPGSVHDQGACVDNSECRTINWESYYNEYHVVIDYGTCLANSEKSTCLFFENQIIGDCRVNFSIWNRYHCCSAGLLSSKLQLRMFVPLYSTWRRP